MPAYKGSNKIGKVYKGNTKIGTIYKGSILVYKSATPFYIIQDHKWTNTTDATYGVNGWLCIDGEGVNWSVNQGRISNNNDWETDWATSTFRSIDKNTQGCTNVRIDISYVNNTGYCDVTLEGSNLGNLCELSSGIYTGTITDNNCYLKVKLRGESAIYIRELYLY